MSKPSQTESENQPYRLPQARPRSVDAIKFELHNVEKAIVDHAEGFKMLLDRRDRLFAEVTEYVRSGGVK